MQPFASSGPIDIGDRVFLVKSPDSVGTLRFFGETAFADGLQMGIELDEPTGKCDGSVDGTQYFSCRPDHGMFIRPQMVAKLEQHGASTKTASVVQDSVGGNDAENCDAADPAESAHKDDGSQQAVDERPARVSNSLPPLSQKLSSGWMAAGGLVAAGQFTDSVGADTAEAPNASGCVESPDAEHSGSEFLTKPDNVATDVPARSGDSHAEASSDSKAEASRDPQTEASRDLQAEADPQAEVSTETAARNDRPMGQREPETPRVPIEDLMTPPASPRKEEPHSTAQVAPEGMRKRVKQRSFSEQGTDFTGSELLIAIADTLGVRNPKLVMFAGLVWLMCFIFLGVTGDLVCTFWGCSYPMYASFSALTEGPRWKVRMWLKYWVVFAIITLLEYSFSPLVTVFRYHHLMKLGFIIWLTIPTSGGIQIVYGWMLAPLLRLFRPKIERAFAHSKAELSRTLSSDVYEQLQSAASDGEAYLKDRVAQEITKAAVAQLGQISANETSDLDAAPGDRQAKKED